MRMVNISRIRGGIRTWGPVFLSAMLFSCRGSAGAAQFNLKEKMAVNGVSIFKSSVTVTAPLGIGVLRTSYGANRDLSPAAAAQYGGIYSSTHVYVAGNVYAGNYYGDGSGLSGLSGASPVGAPLTSANIWVGNAGGQAAAVAMGGEGSLSNTGAFTLSRSMSPVWTAAHTFNSGLTSPGVQLAPGVALSSTTAARYGGVYASTHVYVDGGVYAAKFYGDGSNLTGITASGGDDLGGHTAAQNLDLNSWDAVGVSSVNFRSSVFIASAAAAQLGGVYVSTNLFVAGVSSAAAYYGDGSKLTGLSTSLRIGDSYGGGIVFWVDSKGRNALIAPTADQSSSIQWAPSNATTGATLNGVYAGRPNTVMISTMTGPGTYAARLCQDYAVTVDAVYYDDWYLPSKDELLLLYGQKGVVGGFSPAALYWSSTESDATNAFSVNFGFGSAGIGSKANSNDVRCIRAGPFSSFDYSRDAETVRDGAYLTSTQTFTGENTFAGTARLAKDMLRAETGTSITLTGADFGKTITVNNSATQTVYLPSVTAADIGATLKIVKLGAGKVIIDAADSDTVGGSGAGGTIYNNAVLPPQAGVELRLVSETAWAITGGHCAWITTSGAVNLSTYSFNSGLNCGGVYRLPDAGQTTSYGTGDDAAYQPAKLQMSYTVNADNTVTDNITGLVWRRCYQGRSDDATCTGTSGTYTWENAVTQCQNETADGGGWRLPNAKELFSIVDMRASGLVYINQTVFPGSSTENVWTSTTYMPNSSQALVVYFGYGYTPNASKTLTYPVRCVRSGL